MYMKNYAKRIAAWMLVCAVLLGFSGCRKTVPAAENAVVTTNFALYDLARQAYPGAVVMLLSPGTESHDFECTLSDIATIAHASLVLYVGGEGDDWMDDVLARVAESGDPVPYLRAMDVIAGESALLHEAEALESDGHTHDHDHAHDDDGHDHDHDQDDHDQDDHDDHDDHDHGTYLTAADAVSHTNASVYVRTDPPAASDSYDGYDEHVWTDPANAILLLHGIRDALASLDLPTADTAAYENRLLEADAGFRALALSGEGEIGHLLFADRFPFLYFAHAYGIAYTAAFAGCSSDTEPSLGTLSHLLAEMDETDPAAIFVIEFSDRKTAEFLASAHPCRVEELSSGHNVTKADFDAGVTLADLCERNLAALRDLSR